MKQRQNKTKKIFLPVPHPAPRKQQHYIDGEDASPVWPRELASPVEGHEQGILSSIQTYFPGLTLGVCFWPLSSIPLYPPQLSGGYSSWETLLKALLAKSFCALR